MYFNTSLSISVFPLASSVSISANTSLNTSSATYGDNVTVYATVVNNDDNSVLINEGNVDFYFEGEHIGNANVINGVASLENVKINTTGIITVSCC